MADEDLARHTRALRSVAATPIRPGHRVTLLAEAMDAIEAMFDAIAGARHTIVLEYYTLENVEAGGRSLEALLRDRLAAGVKVAIIYDAIGSDHGQPGLFDALAGAGAQIIEYHGLNPLRRFFSVDINHRDHRKILVVDDRVAFLGGVNMDRQYMNPPSAGIPADGNTRRAFWQDAAIRIEGPVVGDTRAIFDATWRAQDGDPFPPAGDPPPPLPDGEHVCVEGTAPREGSLHTRAVLAAIRAARSEILLATGYFVPMPDEVVALRFAARRGVSVRLIVPGVSDVSGAVHAGRATYGRLLRAGVRVHEAHRSVLHAKVAVIDGVWSSVGSSNFDRRSARLNNEVDAIVLGRQTSSAVRDMMSGWFEAGRRVTLRDWTDRPPREHLGELTALVWSRLM